MEVATVLATLTPALIVPAGCGTLASSCAAIALANVSPTSGGGSAQICSDSRPWPSGLYAISASRRLAVVDSVVASLHQRTEKSWITGLVLRLARMVVPQPCRLNAASVATALARAEAGRVGTMPGRER